MAIPMQRPQANYDRAAAIERKRIRDAARVPQAAQPMQRPQVQMQAPIGASPQEYGFNNQNEFNAYQDAFNRDKQNYSLQVMPPDSMGGNPGDVIQSLYNQAQPNDNFNSYVGAQQLPYQRPGFKPTAGGAHMQGSVMGAMKPQGILSQPPARPAPGQYSRVSPGMYRDAQGRLVKR